MSLTEINKRDAESGQLWFTGPASFTALAARDRRVLLAELAKLNNDLTACQLERDRLARLLWPHGLPGTAVINTGPVTSFPAMGVPCFICGGKHEGLQCRVQVAHDHDWWDDSMKRRPVDPSTKE